MSTDILTPDAVDHLDEDHRDLDEGLASADGEPDDNEIVDDGEDNGSDSASGTTGKGTAQQRGLTRGSIRRIAVKAEEVTATPDRIVEITASVLGVGTGLAEITTAIMAAPRGVTAPISDLTMIAESDQFEAAVNAGGLGRDRMKAVWNLLVALGVVKGAMPGATGKAAIAIVRPVFGLDDIAKAEIEAVASLLKKN